MGHVAASVRDFTAPWRIADLAAIADGVPLCLDSGAAARVAAAAALLQRAVAARARIYGVTTGYGPLACHYVAPDLATDLQRNLIYHLASGVGPSFDRRNARAIMAARANNLAQGYSAIRPASLQLLLDCLNADLLPVIPQQGTVGASGDLTPLAHLALLLLGEGDCTYQGLEMPAAAGLARAGLRPLCLTYKEGLALVNGTSAMTAVAALTCQDAAQALRWAVLLAVAHAEALAAREEAWHPLLASIRPHPGQQQVTLWLNRLAADSRCLQPKRATFLPQGDGVLADRELPQDPYSSRCAPQILGAIADAIQAAAEIIAREINSVTDNPVMDPGSGQIIHGGNFQGQHVAFAADWLHGAIIHLANLAERRLARLTDPARNNGLPAFLTGGRVGLHSGLMGAQVTATALVAEMRAGATMSAVQTLATNANNQDIVSMGTIAARRAQGALASLWSVLAIEAMACAQAFDLQGGAGYSQASQTLHGWVRQSCAFIGDDRPLAADIAALAGRMAAALSPPVAMTADTASPIF